MWRGLGLETSLAKGRHQAAELAGFRRDCTDQRAAYDRARAALLKSRRSRPPGCSSARIYGNDSSDEFGQLDEGPWACKERTNAAHGHRNSDDSLWEIGDLGESPTLGSEASRPGRHSTMSYTSGRGTRTSMMLGIPSLQTGPAAPFHEVAAMAVAAMRWTKASTAPLDQQPKTSARGSAEGSRMTASIEMAMLMEAGWDTSEGGNKGDKSPEPPFPKPDELPDRITATPQSVAPSSHSKQDAEAPGRRVSGRRASSLKGGPRRRRSSVLGGRQRSPDDIQRSIASMSKVRRLLEARKNEFEAMPCAERQRLKRAFAVGDPDNKAYLTTEGLRIALCDLGLDGRTRQEKSILQDALHEATAFGKVNFFDFVFNLVPKVEHRLQEARSPKLYADFTAFDSGSAGKLNQASCLQALRRHALSLAHIDEEIAKNFWKGFERDFPETFKTHARYGTYNSTEVDFAGFQELAKFFQTERSEFLALSERRTAVDARLPPNIEAAHFGELTYLRRIFGKNLRSEVVVLNKVETLKALIECGAMPVVGDPFERANAFFCSDDDSLAFFRFTDFLQYVRQVRKEEGAVRKTKINNLLGSPKFPDTPPMLSAEVPNLFAEAGFCRDCCYATDELVPVVEECNRGGGDSLGLDELVALAGKVVQWTRSVARNREKDVANSFGLDSDQVLQLRFAFAENTKTGALGLAELRRYLKDLNPTVTPSQSELEDLIVELGPEAPVEVQESMIPIEPLLTDGGSLNLQPDQKEEARCKVLLFEGYLKLMGRLAEEEG